MNTNSAVEFLVLLLVAASGIAVLSKYLRIPYTAALVVGGILLGLIRVPHLSPISPGQRPHWLTPDIILLIFLPALVFEGSVKLNIRELARDSTPLLILANIGVLLAMVVTGSLVHWTIGLPILTALLFGAIISATDPISVLAIFRDLNMDRRLSTLVEGESLLNDGTAAALFQIMLAAVIGGHLSFAKGAGMFLLDVGGGAVVGFACGYAASRITEALDAPEVEITLTTIVAYGSYMAAYHLHLSAIIATAMAGLTIGNVGAKRGMSESTRSALVSFWEYFAFVMNSLIFLLIGLEVRINTLAESWRPLLLAVAAVLAGRAVSIYLLVPASNLIAEKIPLRWQHVMVWGGLRGGLALALALSLDPSFLNRSQVLTLTFGVVVFSILVQGLTMKPLLELTRLASEKPEAGNAAKS
jgi:CPA1 family monovalent cation:H+ antiporter